jgi:hypothetical protein
MKNSDMKRGRIKRWCDARKKSRWIWDQVNAGKTVYLSTYTHVTKINKKNLALVYATTDGLIVQHGRQKVCYDFAKITAE